MGKFRGKKKLGLRLALYRKPNVFRRSGVLHHTDSTLTSPFKSPCFKKIRPDSQTKHTPSPRPFNISSIKRSRPTSNSQTPRSSVKRKKISFKPVVDICPRTFSRRRLLYSTPKEMKTSNDLYIPLQRGKFSQNLNYGKDNCVSFIENHIIPKIAKKILTSWGETSISRIEKPY